MNYEEVQRFDNELRANPVLLAKVKDGRPDPEKVLAIAEANGFNFSLEQLLAYIEERKGRLDDDQLDLIAGGADICSIDDPAAMIAVR